MTCPSCEEARQRFKELQEEGALFLLEALSVCKTCEHFIVGVNGVHSCEFNCCQMMFRISGDTITKAVCPKGKWQKTSIGAYDDVQRHETI